MKKKFILAIFGISLLFMACQEDSYYNDYDMGGKNSSILTEAIIARHKEQVPSREF